jgi:hypothetical protein
LEVIIISQPFPEMTVRKAILHIFFASDIIQKSSESFQRLKKKVSCYLIGRLGA